MAFLRVYLGLRAQERLSREVSAMKSWETSVFPNSPWLPSHWNPQPHLTGLLNSSWGSSFIHGCTVFRAGKSHSGFTVHLRNASPGHPVPLSGCRVTQSPSILPPLQPQLLGMSSGFGLGCLHCSVIGPFVYSITNDKVKISILRQDKKG